MLKLITVLATGATANLIDEHSIGRNLVMVKENVRSARECKKTCIDQK